MSNRPQQTSDSDGPAIVSDLVRADGRPRNVVAFESAVVSFFVHAADLLGVPKSVAAIYGICFASPEPLGFSEIQERLEMSSGSISQGLRVLRESGALKVANSGRTVEQLSGGTARRSSRGTVEQLSSGSVEQLSGVVDGTAVEPSSSGSDTDLPPHRSTDQPINRSTDLPREARAGRARERYVPDLELRKLVSRWLEERLQKQIETGSSQLRRVSANIPGGSRPAAAVLRERLSALQKWHRQARAVLPLVRTFLKLT